MHLVQIFNFFNSRFLRLVIFSISHRDIGTVVEAKHICFIFWWPLTISTFGACGLGWAFPWLLWMRIGTWATPWMLAQLRVNIRPLLLPLLAGPAWTSYSSFSFTWPTFSLPVWYFLLITGPIFSFYTCPFYSSWPFDLTFFLFIGLHFFTDPTFLLFWCLDRSQLLASHMGKGKYKRSVKCERFVKYELKSRKMVAAHSHI